VTWGQRFARLATDVVVRQPALWRLFRRATRKQFDKLAPVWDARRDPVAFAPVAAALETLPAPPQRVLDLGTGTGSVARLVKERFPDADVVGVDLSEAMIAEARAKTEDDQVRYVVADAQRLPFEDGVFDLVTLGNMIPFFDELARVVGAGGRVLFAFSAGPSTPIYVAPERLRAELSRRGFGQFGELAAGRGTALVAARAERG
jgi:ubiquinone/menaquinone biosynthesis C-methylase UbiE